MHAKAEAEQGESLARRLGIDQNMLQALSMHLQAELSGPQTDPAGIDPEPDEEELMLRELLLRNRDESQLVGEWLAHIVARRSMESSHLWEDLGLAARGDLSRLFDLYFHDLAAKNTRNMRWKRFLYRSLCEAEGFSLCTSPTCDTCSEFHICFGDESGESVMARNKRLAAE
jgi:nitrogen fixation protein NifQ